MCPAHGPLACQRPPTPEPVAGGSPLGGRDLRLWEQATPAQAGACVGIALVVGGLPALEGLPGEGLPADAREGGIGAEVGEPVPGEPTCDHDDPMEARLHDRGGPTSPGTQRAGTPY